MTRNVRLTRHAHVSHLRKAALRNAAATTAAVSNDTTTTFCLQKPTTTAASDSGSGHRKRKRSDSASSMNDTSNCVDLPRPDQSYQNFCIIMVVILSCIFAVIFVVFYFCTKDLFLELVGKAKSYLKPRKHVVEE